ncbi:protein of unknown function [Candidatus Filomicrobium marinum]|uniref:Uncharacterized protein n=1 Tax=Candidatus Filomicrobium marinum TaxID=1608628 RepID=A0A0D6JJ62_9HYPH|nr:protein of unknown function [Candidatus Filomicrobium marinum]CPR21747.1 protein of unknown function [Candidatus Filomicrobium marinum]
MPCRGGIRVGWIQSAKTKKAEVGTNLGFNPIFKTHATSDEPLNLEETALGIISAIVIPEACKGEPDTLLYPVDCGANMQAAA